MKTLLIIHSYHHNNTQKIGKAIADVLNAKLQKAVDTNPEELSSYDLLGFGAGIDSAKHYKPMLEFAKTLPHVQGKPAFILSTAAVAGKQSKKERDHKALREILLSKGYKIIDEFQCKGFNTNSFLKYFGGMNKGRPNADDLKNAEAFAKKVLSSNEVKS